MPLHIHYPGPVCTRYLTHNGVVVHSSDMTHNARIIAATAIAVPALMFGMAGAIGAAYAWPASAEPSSTVTVDGSDYATDQGSGAKQVIVDDTAYPVCQLEDCSDQPNQIGVWFDPDSGQPWLSVGDHSLPIATGANAWDAGAYVGGWN